MYLDSLDPDHSLFLQPEVEQYKNKYGSNFGASLKAGDLSGPYTIHAQYRQRLAAFYQFMLNELKKQQNLKQPNVFIETDREKAPYFKTTAEQQDFWRKMLVSQLINLTITKEEELAKQKRLKITRSWQTAGIFPVLRTCPRFRPSPNGIPVSWNVSVALRVTMCWTKP